LAGHADLPDAALELIEHVTALARYQVRLMCRLVKGAYWDAEIKRAQELGLPHYPVFTHKHHTDVSYLACARALLDVPDAIYPQFATHNAATIAAILQMAPHRRAL
jgi:RHH-type proline utilization regulon transcriptional repressor/proline dehydrogenase/delta 1-pyrroline-5-carboxylate dehydrogenase